MSNKKDKQVKKPSKEEIETIKKKKQKLVNSQQTIKK
jgi:hypothetical protein